MAKILERIRAWRRQRANSEPVEPGTEKDWKYQGKTFRASDVASHNTMTNLPSDEGRPRH